MQHAQASYLITFRDTDGTRLPLLETVLDWLGKQPQLQVIVVEQDVSSRIQSTPFTPNVELLLAHNDGPFNKSWGLNIAARRAAHDLLVVGDADMFMSGDTLNRALHLCRRRCDAVNPYLTLVDLTVSETRSLLLRGCDVDHVQRGARADRIHEGEHLCYCGGICVFRSEVYFALGGMDERFLGWGGEDDAMTTNLHRYTDRLAALKNGVAYHLWHPRPADRYHHPHYRRNLALSMEYRRLDQEALDKQRAEHRAVMGDPERYRRCPEARARD